MPEIVTLYIIDDTDTTLIMAPRKTYLISEPRITLTDYCSGIYLEHLTTNTSRSSPDAIELISRTFISTPENHLIPAKNSFRKVFS